MGGTGAAPTTQEPAPETPTPEEPAPETTTPEMPEPEAPESETPEPETPETETPTPEQPATPSEQAEYRVTFQATWSAATHPTNFPRGAHFSGLVGATHDENTTLWQSGQLASAGIEVMAETGGKSQLQAEIRVLIDAGTARGELSGGGPDSPGSVSLEFDAVLSHPYVSLVSMLAPSPDWFVGVSGLSLLSGDGTWKESATVSLLLYDAGTDDGATFTAANADSNPAQPISRLTSGPGDTDFRSGAPAVGTFVFEKLD